MQDAHGDAIRQREILQARVEELERQLRDRAAEEGSIEDDRPFLRTPEANLYYRDFWRLIESTGMGGVNLDWWKAGRWARENGEDPELARDLLYEMLSAYHEINAELTKK